MSGMTSQTTGVSFISSTVLFRRIPKKISKLRVTGLCEGNTPVTGLFPAQRASNAAKVSIWWRHHVLSFLDIGMNREPFIPLDHGHKLLHSLSLLAMGLSVCQLGKRHGLQLAGIILWWLVGLNIAWNCQVLHCIMGSCDQWGFPPFFRPQWQSLCTALTAGKCLPLGLHKGTVKECTMVSMVPMTWRRRSHVISSHAIDLVCPEYFSLSTRGVNKENAHVHLIFRTV